MSDVEFDEPQYSLNNIKYVPTNPRTPVMNAVIKMKLAKNPEQAAKVLIGLSVVSLALSFIFVKTFVFSKISIPDSVYIK